MSSCSPWTSSCSMEGGRRRSSSDKSLCSSSSSSGDRRSDTVRSSEGVSMTTWDSVLPLLAFLRWWLRWCGWCIWCGGEFTNFTLAPLDSREWDLLLLLLDEIRADMLAETKDEPPISLVGEGGLGLGSDDESTLSSEGILRTSSSWPILGWIRRRDDINVKVGINDVRNSSTFCHLSLASVKNIAERDDKREIRRIRGRKHTHHHRDQLLFKAITEEEEEAKDILVVNKEPTWTLTLALAAKKVLCTEFATQVCGCLFEKDGLTLFVAPVAQQLIS